MARRTGPDNPLWEIADNIAKAAEALTRQANVMERDVEAEALPKTIEDALEKQSETIIVAYVNWIHKWAADLNEIITRTYLNDMDRARTIRDFQQKLEKFSGIGIDGLS